VQNESNISDFEQLLPLAAEWAREQEQRILREGRSLSPQEIVDARAVGVREPERVRVLAVNQIPTPPTPVLKSAAAQINLLPTQPSGLTFRYGIFLRTGCEHNRNLVLHELVHTAQYERLGGIVPFLRDYLSECTTVGYEECSLEREADAIAAELCAS
jgi:hypothetical protein